MLWLLLARSLCNHHKLERSAKDGERGMLPAVCVHQLQPVLHADSRMDSDALVHSLAIHQHAVWVHAMKLCPCRC